MYASTFRARVIHVCNTPETVVGDGTSDLKPEYYFVASMSRQDCSKFMIHFPVHLQGDEDQEFSGKKYRLSVHEFDQARLWKMTLCKVKVR